MRSIQFRFEMIELTKVNVVSDRFMILQQDEFIFKRGSFVFNEEQNKKYGLSVKSSACPQFSVDAETVYIRGTNRGLDNDCAERAIEKGEHRAKANEAIRNLFVCFFEMERCLMKRYEHIINAPYMDDIIVYHGKTIFFNEECAKFIVRKK